MLHFYNWNAATVANKILIRPVGSRRAWEFTTSSIRSYVSIHSQFENALFIHPVGKRAGLYTQLCFPDEVEEADIT